MIPLIIIFHRLMNPSLRNPDLMQWFYFFIYFSNVRKYKVVFKKVSHAD